MLTGLGVGAGIYKRSWTYALLAVAMLVLFHYTLWNVAVVLLHPTSTNWAALGVNPLLEPVALAAAAYLYFRVLGSYWRWNYRLHLVAWWPFVLLVVAVSPICAHSSECGYPDAFAQNFWSVFGWAVNVGGFAVAVFLDQAKRVPLSRT